MICTTCGGKGIERCKHCLCLDCSGTGKTPCRGCNGGKTVCPDCRGTGKSKGVFGEGKCRKCDATGIIYHDSCGGSGKLPCLSCAGLGYVPECEHCGGSSTFRCSTCFGTGLLPTPVLVQQASTGALARLLTQLPVMQTDTAGETHGLEGTIRRILSFLSFYHWSSVDNPDDAEHELCVQEAGLHLRISLLSLGTSTTTKIDYHFLDVVRTANTAYRVRYVSESKAWR